MENPICPECHIGYMMQHPEQPRVWKKCCLCGYCKRIDLPKEVVREESDEPK